MCVLCVRFWDCSVCEWTARGSSQSHAQEVMQHADVSALRLLEVLLMTLPQTLLQTYALTVTDYAFSSPGQSWDRKLFETVIVYVIPFGDAKGNIYTADKSIALSMCVFAVALCGAVCLLSLSWALVLYSRACCLIRPGHLQMPPAALLCQLLWRMGMLAARFTSLALFTRTFGCWVIGVLGEFEAHRLYRCACPSFVCKLAITFASHEKITLLRVSKI